MDRQRRVVSERVASCCSNGSRRPHRRVLPTRESLGSLETNIQTHRPRAASGNKSPHSRAMRPKMCCDWYFCPTPVVTAPPVGRAEYCDERVCLCVCLSAIISMELHVRSSLNFCACYLWPWLGPPLSA